jgi:hypothetical protein
MSVLSLSLIELRYEFSGAGAADAAAALPF